MLRNSFYDLFLSTFDKQFDPILNRELGILSHSIHATDNLTDRALTNKFWCEIHINLNSILPFLHLNLLHIDLIFKQLEVCEIQFSLWERHDHTSKRLTYIAPCRATALERPRDNGSHLPHLFQKVFVQKFLLRLWPLLQMHRFLLSPKPEIHFFRQKRSEWGEELCGRHETIVKHGERSRLVLYPPIPPLFKWG